jgi:dipeptidyl aminopeptidase/acylaminoacyl peptidase
MRRTSVFGCGLAIALGLLPGPFLSAQESAVAVEEDVIYCRIDGAALLADIGYPSAGRWRAGSKDDVQRGLDVREWARQGYFAMTIDYRLVTSTPAPAAQQDLMCAIRWLHAHADQYRVDPDRIYLSGWSSGGHQVALAATAGADLYPAAGDWQEARSDIRAVMSMSGAYDLNTLPWGNLWTPLEGDSVEARRIASPMQQISRETRPILVVHSDDDGSVPVQQALDMVRALEQAGVPHRFVHYTDRGHVALTPEVIVEMRSFIAEVERNGW